MKSEKKTARRIKNEKKSGINFTFKQCTFYLVHVAFRPNNPIHSAILYSGFVSPNGKLGTYSYLTAPGYEIPYYDADIYYLHVIRVLVTEEEWNRDLKLSLPPFHGTVFEE